MASPSDLGIDGIEDLASLDIDGSAVFRAREVRHHRQVAIKILDSSRRPLVPPRRLDPRSRALHAFAHTSGIVPVYRTGTTSYGDRYLIMPLYRAGSLADQLAYGSTPWHASAALVAQIAEVLANGHVAGVVLTGITPSSILLSNATSPVLAVYGMAMGHLDDGRPSYRAPELDRGGTATAAADVYSLGLNLAALIAGRPPTGTRPCRNLLDEVEAVAPARIVDVLARATQERPADRYRAAGEFAVALRAAIHGDQIPDAPPPPGTDNSFDLDAILGPLTSSRSVPARTNERDRIVHKSKPPLPSSIAHRAGATPAQAVAMARLTTTPDSQPANGETLNPVGATTEVTDRPEPRAERAEAGIDSAAEDIDLTDADIDLTVASTDYAADVSAPPPPIATTPFVPINGLGGDDDVPFRTVEHPRVSTNPSGLIQFLDRVQVAWLGVRRSLGALLAVITLLVIAGIVAMVVLQQRQAAQTESGGSFTTAQDDGSSSTFRPTSVAPVFLEPPATHPRSSQQRTQATNASATSVTARSTASSLPSQTVPASTSVNRFATPRPSTPASITSTARAESAPPDESPSVSLAASRLRRTSARIRLSSDTCVTVSFSYTAVGGSSAPGGTIGGGPRCATSHNLNLGQVTQALVPDTTYTVRVTATDQRGRSTSSTVSFTTLT